MEPAVLGQTAVISDVSLIERSFDLKTAAVLFDQVIVLETPEWQYRYCAGQKGTTIEQCDAEFDDMLRDGFILPQRYELSENFLERNQSYAAQMHWLGNTACNLLLSPHKHARQILDWAGDWRARAVAAARAKGGQDVHVPVLFHRPTPSGWPNGEPQTSASYMSAVQIVLRNFPLPPPTAAWSTLKLFRADRACCGAFRILRSWLTESAKGSADVRELEDKLLIEMQDYGRRLDTFKLKSRLGEAKAIAIAAADLGPLLLKLRWGELVQRFFAIAEEKVKVIEEERELARRGPHYLWDASHALR